MLYRTIEDAIYQHFADKVDKVLIVSGARQVGKSFIIRHVAKKIFQNIIEINLIEDAEGQGIFKNVRTTDDFYLALGFIAGNKMGDANDTLVFLDEIQQYPHLLTMLKFLRQEGRFTYVASGSLLGVTLKQTTSIPLGSIRIMRMYPLNFEEFLIANGVSKSSIDNMRESFESGKSLSQGMHDKIISLFKRYLLVGGMPDAVNEYLKSHNIVAVREIQQDIHNLYAIDASKYDIDHRLKISGIYNLIPSNMENKKKRFVYRDIENKTGKRAEDYLEEIDYLISSGIALDVKAISNPTFPLKETEHKNLYKLYLNDVGLLTNVLYRNNILPVINDEAGVNLGSVYECAVATELKSHSNPLFYYDNRARGEVDFLIDDYMALSVLPIEVKSGKDYKRHSAMTRFVSTPDYNIARGYVLSNNREVECNGKIIYIPIYYSMFLTGNPTAVPKILF